MGRLRLEASVQDVPGIVFAALYWLFPVNSLNYRHVIALNTMTCLHPRAVHQDKRSTPKAWFLFLL